MITAEVYCYNVNNSTIWTSLLDLISLGIGGLIIVTYNG